MMLFLDCLQFLIFPSCTCWDRLLDLKHYSTSIKVFCTHLVCNYANLLKKKKGSNVRKSFKFHRIYLGHQYGHGFIVLGHQYGHGFIVLGRQYGHGFVVLGHQYGHGFIVLGRQYGHGFIVLGRQYCKRGVCNRLILAGEYSHISSLFVAMDFFRK